MVTIVFFYLYLHEFCDLHSVFGKSFIQNTTHKFCSLVLRRNLSFAFSSGIFLFEFLSRFENSFFDVETFAVNRCGFTDQRYSCAFSRAYSLYSDLFLRYFPIIYIGMRRGRYRMSCRVGDAILNKNLDFAL